MNIYEKTSSLVAALQKPIRMEYMLPIDSNNASNFNITYDCQRCGRQYKHQSSLNKHLKYECGVLPKFKCPFCPHRCKQKGHMKTHIALRHRSKIGATEVP